MLNTGVQAAFQEFADTYSHSLTVPTEMVLHNNTFISYKVTNLIWSEHFVAFEATSTSNAISVCSKADRLFLTWYLV